MAKTGNESIDRTVVTTIGEEAGGLSVVRAVANAVDFIDRFVRPKKNEAAIEQQLQEIIKSYCQKGFAPEIDVVCIEDNTITAIVRKLYRTYYKEEEAKLSAKVDSFGKVSEIKLEFTIPDYKPDWYKKQMKEHFETVLRNGGLSGDLHGEPKCVSMGSSRVFIYLNNDEEKSVVRCIKFTFGFEKKLDESDGFLTLVGQIESKLIDAIVELTIPFPDEKQIRSELKKYTKEQRLKACQDLQISTILTFFPLKKDISIEFKAYSFSDKKITFRIRWGYFLNHLPIKILIFYDRAHKIKEYYAFADFHYSLEKKEQTTSLKFLKYDKPKLSTDEGEQDEN
jgi:hypothetical protein